MSNESHVAEAENDEINLLEFLAVIWGGKIWIGLTVMLALIVGQIMVMLTQPIYSADGLLQLEEKSSGLALPLAVSDLAGENPRVSTEIEILRSRMVLEQVVRELDLGVSASPRRLPVIGEALTRYPLSDPGWDSLTPYAWSDERIKLGELVVPEHWIGEELIVTSTGDGGYTVRLPDGAERSGQVRERLGDDARGFSMRIDELEGKPGREFVVRKRNESQMALNLRNRLAVTESSRQSSILKLTFTDADPREAERILNAIAQAYVAQNISRGSAEARQSLQFIEEQLPASKQGVAEAQTALNLYRQEQQSVDLSYETQTLLDRATQLEQELSELALQEEEYKSRFTVNHPSYQALLKNRERIESQLSELREETGALPETQKEIFNLTRDLEVAQQVYLQLLNRAQELQVVQASSIGNVRIIDRAQASVLPIKPRQGRVLLLALLLGLFAGAGAVLLRNMLRRGVLGAEELEKIGLPVFATINYSHDAANHRAMRGTLPILALTKPDDLVVEALRSLRTSLHFGMLDAKTSTVMFTSAAPGAGKSFNAVNLAVVSAQAGQKVCVVDADLRRGYLRRYFGLERNTPGLAELLAGEKTLDEVLCRGPVDALDVIPSGRFPPNPSELLMRATFPELLEELNTRYDLIIIDSPPTLAVTDPVIMGRSVGATIVVVRHMETAIREVEAVRQMFETAGSRIAGAVLNGYTAMGGAYGSRHYYYNYRYAYKTDEK
ncbi:polysaccharide biosynthesis tyrosine autokinase [Actibacterium sp. D379-3]